MRQLFCFLGIIIFNLQIYAQPEHVIDSLRTVLNSTKVDTARISILNSLAWKISTNNPDEAIGYAQQASEIARKISGYSEVIRLKYVADSYHQIAWGNYQKGNFDSSLFLNSEALHLRDSIHDEAGISSSYNNIGNVYRRKGELKKALDYYQKALLIFKKLDWKSKIATAYGNIGVAYFDLSNYPKALEYYFNALRIEEELGNKSGIARHYGNIGIVLKDQREYASALDYYSRALKIYESENNKGGISIIYGGIGVVYRRMNDYPKALEYYQKALKLDEEMGNKNGIARHLSNIGVVYGEQKIYDKALTYFLQALEMESEMGNKGEVAIKLINIGSLYRMSGNYRKSHEFLDRGILTAKEVNSLETIKDGYSYLVSLDSSESNFRNAFIHQKLYMAYRDSILNEKNLREIAEIKASFESERKDKEIELLNREKELSAIAINRERSIRWLSIVLAVLLILTGVLLFGRFRQIQANKRINDRIRISSDLHDEIGSSLSKISFMSQVIKRNPAESNLYIDKVIASANETLEQLSNIVWTLNPGNDKLENFISYTRKYAMEYFEMTTIKCTVLIPDDIPKITMTSEQRRNIFLCVKEALHNIIKHSGATEVEILFLIKDNNVEIVIHDNGIGLHHTKGQGNGLVNLDSRMKGLGGKFMIENTNGTTARFTIKLD